MTMMHNIYWKILWEKPSPLCIIQNNSFNLTDLEYSHKYHLTHTLLPLLCNNVPLKNSSPSTTSQLISNCLLTIIEIVDTPSSAINCRALLLPFYPRNWKSINLSPITLKIIDLILLLARRKICFIVVAIYFFGSKIRFLLKLSI